MSGALVLRCRQSNGEVTVKVTSTCHEGKESEVEVLLYSFFNFGARWGWVVIATPRPIYARE
jgi:hypothetical protein